MQHECDKVMSSAIVTLYGECVGAAEGRGVA